MEPWIYVGVETDDGRGAVLTQANFEKLLEALAGSRAPVSAAETAVRNSLRKYGGDSIANESREYLRDVFVSWSWTFDSELQDWVRNNLFAGDAP